MEDKAQISLRPMVQLGSGIMLWRIVGENFLQK